jgi:endo-1,4-beta-xylanase
MAIFCAGVAGDTLRSAAKGRGIHMGAAINAGSLSNDGSYKAKASEQYDLVTAENACKWGGIQQKHGVFDFAQCDSIRDFALQSGGVFRGHNLCWGSYNPSWLQGLDAAGKRRASWSTSRPWLRTMVLTLSLGTL